MKKKLLLFVLTCFILGLVFYKNTSSTSAASGPKYSPRARMGVFFAASTAEGMDKWKYKDLGVGFHIDFFQAWSNAAYRFGSPELHHIVNMNYRWYGTPDTVTDTECLQAKSRIEAIREDYPSGTMFLIGDEMTYDTTITAEQYADIYYKWRQCLKSIDPTFKVAIGALAALSVETPAASQICVGYDSPKSGKNYFRKVVQTAKTKYGVSALPDFVTNNVYSGCRPGHPFYENTNMISTSVFNEEIIQARQLMKELGLQDREYIVQAWAPLNNNTDQAKVNQYMNWTVDYLMSKKDTALGSPNDEYRLVQKWAWFVLDEWHTEAIKDHVNSILVNKAKQLTAAGTNYQQLINKHVQAFAPLPLTQPTYTCNSTAKTVTLKWQSPVTYAYYSFRMNDARDGWEVLSDGKPSFPKDIIRDINLNEVTLPIELGVKYTWWVHPEIYYQTRAESSFTCPLLPLPAPTGLTATCSTTGQLNFKWNAVVGASKYQIRINDLANGWNGTTPLAGDHINSNVATTTYTFNGVLGKTYNWGVDVFNATGQATPSVNINTVCPTIATPSPIAAVCTYDLDTDKQVGVKDFLVFLNRWGTAASQGITYNATGLIQLIGAWGSCPG